MDSNKDLAQRLKTAASKPHKIKFRSGKKLDADELTSAPIAMDDGDIEWTPPAAYLEFLRESGFFQLSWYSASCELHREIALFNPEEIEIASEIVYVPEEVDLGDGEEISTNHLVPFAGDPEGEWAFCFDATQGGADYPVYYHHQDQPRARIKASGQWHSCSSETPDFANFSSWLGWLVKAVEEGSDPEDLGQPFWSPAV